MILAWAIIPGSMGVAALAAAALWNFATGGSASVHPAVSIFIIIAMSSLTVVAGLSLRRGRRYLRETEEDDSQTETG